MKFTWIIVFLAAIAADVNSILNNSFGLRWLLSATTEESKLKEERPLCLTQQCKYLAKSLRESMNQSVNPCEDFYEYSCGNWPKHNPLPVDENQWNFLVKAERKVDDRLKEIMEEEVKPDDLRATKFAKMAFKACLDTDEIERIGLQPLVSTMWRTGGWPLIMKKDEWDQEIYKWQIVDDYYARLTGLNSFHDVQVPMRYLIYNERSRLFVDTPRLSAKVDRLLDFDEIYVASSEEDDLEEESQERGSEEWPRSKEDDEFQMLEKEIVKKNINNRTIHRERISEKIKTMKKHAMEIQLKEGTKGAITRARVGNKRRYVERIVKSWEYELIYKSDSVGKSTETNSGKSHERIEDTNNDLYFDDDDNESEGISADQGEYNSGGKIDENDEENDNSNNAASGSGSGDYEWDDEDGNGSGDYERDDEDSSGNGSGDYKDNDNENRDDDDSDNSDNYDGTSKKDMEVENKRKMYAEYILNVSIALSEARGVSIPRERLLEDIGDLLKFQIRLLTYIHKYKKALTAELKALQNRYGALKAWTENGKINWMTKIKDVFATGGMEIPDDYVLTSADDYIKALTKLLDRTPSRIIVNYIHWNFLSKVIHATTKKMRELYYNWDGKVPTRRTNYCVEEMNAVNILGYEYVKRYLPEEVLQAASDTVNDIQREVEYRVKNSTGVDIGVGHIILDKLIYMKKQIEYPKSYRNITIMKERFRGLSASKSHFENMLSIMRYKKWRNLKTLFSENDASEAFGERTSDNFNPLLVNTMFSLWQNNIQITAANFQQLLFDFRQP
ncbi:uncharacterized protein LOC132916100 isoform X2 [Bombus pascuorum]|nr:uncharacterized protein LOC132916100 isoform X2 [Bombus pascuorum]